MLEQTQDVSIDELLSALVDGELTDVEIDKLLASASPELLERWSRYHVVKDAMGKNNHIVEPVDVFANISAAIDAEPALGQTTAAAEAPATNNIFDESLSALVDGETTELELRRILASKDEDAFAKLSRYHLVNNVLRKEVQLEKVIDVSSAVSAAIAEDDATIDQTPVASQQKTGLWANIGRFSIAASVAGALVVGVQFLSTSEPQNIADNTPAPVSGEPLLGDENSVRVVGNGDSIKAIDETEEELDDAAVKSLNK